MSSNSDKRPAEIFGYPIDNLTQAATEARQQHHCPFLGQECSKQSSLVPYPFGVCSVEYNGELRAICPHRFDQRASDQDVSLVIRDIALDYFGNTDNIVVFPEVGLSGVGKIDYLIIRHKPMKPEVDDFVAVEIQSDSTTGTGHLVQGMRDFVAGDAVRIKTYKFGMNTYDSIKRTTTQLMNKGLVYEAWHTKCYWVMQEYLFTNLVKRYGLNLDGVSEEHATRFALYDLVRKQDRLTLTPTRFVSSSVDAIYQAMRARGSVPSKDAFIRTLNTKLMLELSTK